MTLQEAIEKHFDEGWVGYQLKRGYDITREALLILKDNGIVNINQDEFPVYHYIENEPVKLVGYDKILNGEIISFTPLK